MSILIYNGDNLGNVFNPNVLDLSGVTQMFLYGNGGDDVFTVTDSIPVEMYGGDGNDILRLFDQNDYASGGDGNDTIFAGGGDDTIDGDAGDDTIDGGLGNDTIGGGDGDDFIAGGRGDDYITGDAGNDIINAGNGADSVFGGTGNDVLNGAGGNDYLVGGHGNDVINGGSGDDTILGTKGHNQLSGGTGNDTLNTGDHTSTVDGGTGDDLIAARLKKGGDHTLTGGADADTFEFVYQTSKKSADVTITDFELGVDEFIVGGLTSAEWVEAYFAFSGAFGIDILTEVDGNAVLNIGFNDTITFEGITEAEFEAFYLDDPLALV